MPDLDCCDALVLVMIMSSYLLTLRKLRNHVHIHSKVLLLKAVKFMLLELLLSGWLNLYLIITSNKTEAIVVITLVVESEVSCSLWALCFIKRSICAVKIVA